MSLLIDLLQKIKKGRSVREVPPLLERASNKPPKRRWGYFLVVLCALLSVVAGFMFVRLFKGKGQVSIRKVRVIAKRDTVRNQRPAVRTKPEKRSSVRQGINSSKKGGITHEDTKKVSSATYINKSLNKAIKKHMPKPPVKKMKNSVAKKSPPEKNTTPVDYYLYQAIKAEKQGRFYNAINLYKRALKQESKKPSLLNKLSYLYIKVKSPDEAIIYAEKALKLQPDYVDAAVNLSVALMMTGRVDEAIDTLTSAYKQSPDDKRVIYNLAILYERKGDLENAQRFYKELYRMGDINGLLGLARIQERKGNIGKAIQYYREALKRSDLGKAEMVKLQKRISILSQVGY